MRDPELKQQRALLEQTAPKVEFNMREPSLKEIQEVVKAARAGSAPGPSGISYKVYKCCSELLQLLWKLLKPIWRRGVIAKQWRYAEGVWIPKEEICCIQTHDRLLVKEQLH